MAVWLRLYKIVNLLKCSLLLPPIDPELEEIFDSFKLSAISHRWTSQITSQIKGRPLRPSPHAHKNARGKCSKNKNQYEREIR